MFSSPASRSNSMSKLHRRRSTATTSGVGESLFDDDLEWDRSDFTRHLPESDALSSYDVNEMAEILRNRFLEFDMLSQVNGRMTPDRQSIISELFTPTTPSHDFTIEELLKIRRLAAPLTFDLDSVCGSFQPNFRLMTQPTFHRSLPDLRAVPRRQSVLASKHFSLMDLKSVEWTFLKRATPRAILLSKTNHRTSYSHLPELMEPEPEAFLFGTGTASVNYSRLSKLAMFRLYMAKLREKLCSLVKQTMQPSTSSPSRMPVITEETIETYDIIEE